MTLNKFYEYKIISIYMDKNSSLVFDFFDKTFSAQYIHDALNYLGAQGWKLVNSTDFIGSEFKNIGIIPLYVENYRTQTQTVLQFLTFIRETNEFPSLENNYFAEYAKKIAPLQERTEKIENLKELSINYFKNHKKYILVADRGDVLIFSIPGTPIEIRLKITETDAIALEDGKEYSILDDIINYH